MSAKPSTLPEWNTGGTNRTAPSPTRKVLGWLLGERPAGGYFNHLAYWTFKWLEYLKDGALSGNHSITGDLNVTGALTGTGILKHGDRVKSACVIDGLYNGALSWNTSNAYAASSAAGEVWKSVPFTVGDRIKTATATVYGNSSVIATVELLIVKADGTTVFAVVGSTPAAAWSQTTAGVAINYTLAAGDAVYVHVAFDATGGRVKNVSVTYDRP